MSLTDSSVKHDWYQTESFVVIELRIKNKKEEEVSVEFTPDHVKVTVTGEEPSPIEFSVIPCHSIVPEKSLFKVLKTKIEVKLKKSDGLRWETLERKENSEAAQVKTISSSVPSSEVPPTYPSSSKKKHDWSKIEAEVTKEEEEPVEGEDALRKLFNKIYGESSDEVKKAMMKSFSESGGTVLSTNWEDVSKGKVEVKPPDGMEFRKWEQ